MSGATATRAEPNPTYRVCRSVPEATVSGANAFAVIDEHSGATVATGQVVGRVTTSQLDILAGGARLALAADRRLLPTSWTLSEAAGRSAVRFDAELARKLLLPLGRTALVIHDGRGESLRLVDVTSSTGERMLGLSRGDWSLLRGERAVATLTRLPSPQTRSKGVRGWLRAMLATSDRALVSLGGEHALSPAATLALVLLFNELTESPA